MSSATKLEYHDIARIQIDTAIDHYNDENFICAITLAAAGEEILGKLLPSNQANAMDQMVKSILKIAPDLSEKEIRDSYLNLVKNSFKHVVEDICEKDINIRLQAIQYIGRACVNYVTLKNDLTPKMIKFSNEHPPEKIDGTTEAA